MMTLMRIAVCTTLALSLSACATGPVPIVDVKPDASILVRGLT